jgi:hypothetical protein
MTTLIHQEVNHQVREAALKAFDAITDVVKDPKIKTHGLLTSQVAALLEARDALREALG